MGQYIVLHMEKRMEISPILERHITRVEVRYVNGVRVEYVWTPDNADPKKAELNRELVSRERKDEEGKVRTLTINQAIRERIKEAGIKKIRKNQHTALEVILSGSSDTLNSLSKEDIDRWADESIEWAKKQWGEKNVVSAVLHCDETTPHIHLILVPIVQGESRRTASKKRKLAKEGKTTKKYNINSERARLSANEVYTQPRLYGYHTSYAEKVGSHFGLSRGILAQKGSFKKHQDSIKYNRQLAQEAAEYEAQIKTIQSDYSEAEGKLNDTKAMIQTNESIISLQDSKVKELEEKTSSLSVEISNKETRITELDTSIEEKALEEHECWQLKDALERHNEKLTLENQTLEETISANKETVNKQEQYLRAFQDVDLKIQEKKKQLQSLSSMGLMNLIKEIPNLIKQDIQTMVSKYWKGEVISFKETTCKERGEDQDMVEVHINFNQTEYYIEVSQATGLVWKDGDNKPYKWKNGDTMYMPELANYFREEVNSEAKEFVESLYRKPEAETVWECKLNCDECRIIKRPDGKYELQKKEWDKTKIDEKGKYTTRIWVKAAAFKSFKELRRDETYAMLKVVHSNEDVDYINQYGSKLNNKQLKTLGVKSGFSQGF